MSAASVSAIAKANLGGAAPRSKNTQSGYSHGLLVDCLRRIFPGEGQPWFELTRILSLSKRAAKHRVAGSRQFSINELRELLHSEHGFDYLAALMTCDQPPRWWRLCGPLMEIAEVQAMQIKARRKLARALKGAIDADRDLSAALAQGEAALAVQDADFYGAHFDQVRRVAAAPRAAAGVPDRALAQAAGQNGRR